MIIIPGQGGTYRHLRARVTHLLADSGQTGRLVRVLRAMRGGRDGEEGEDNKCGLSAVNSREGVPS